MRSRGAVTGGGGARRVDAARLASRACASSSSPFDQQREHLNKPPEPDRFLGVVVGDVERHDNRSIGPIVGPLRGVPVRSLTRRDLRMMEPRASARRGAPSEFLKDPVELRDRFENSFLRSLC
jgi:hypothetical protein